MAGPLASTAQLKILQPICGTTRRCSFGTTLHSRHIVTHINAQPQKRDDSNLSRLEVEVPFDQRPVNELNQLKESILFSWATLDNTTYIQRLGTVYTVFFLFVSGPISYQTFNPSYQPIEFAFAASTGALLVVAAACLRMYIGWKYVADRLMTATLEYEESGWYDGQYFVKPPEILTRDRLLGTYEVRPLMSRLRTSLQLVGGLLAANALCLSIASKNAPDYSYMPTPTQVMSDGAILYSKNVRSLNELLTDDEAAAAEAEAQGGMPGYCGSRYIKAYAGGEAVCDKLAKERR